MGRHKQPVILHLKTRPQVLLGDVLLDIHGTRYKTLENEIKDFQKALGSRLPLMEKAVEFQKWKKSIVFPVSSDRWNLFLKFLVDDCVYFAADRERIATFNSDSVDSWRTRNCLAICQWESMGVQGTDTIPNIKKPRPQEFHPALNEALWKRYQGMKHTLEELLPCIDHIVCCRDIGLYQIFLRVEELLKKEHAGSETDLGTGTLAQMKEKLKLEQLFSEEDVDAASEFCAGLHNELSCSDPYAVTHALIWFFYLSNKQLLLQANQDGCMGALECQKRRFSPRKYKFYRDKFLELQRMFPPQRDIKQVTEIQRELFLLMTGFFQKGCNDPEFQDLTTVRFYQRICEIANQRAIPDPALLWSYPWGRMQKEEYNHTGDIEIYHKLCVAIQKRPDIISREKRKLDNELAEFLAGEGNQLREQEIKLLCELVSPSKCKVLDSNGELCYRDATNKPDFFQDPVELPKRLTAEEMRYLPRCIREYTALSLYQERLAKEMKETAFKMLTSFYHGG